MRIQEAQNQEIALLEVMIKERKLYLCGEWKVEDEYGSDAGDDDG